jgi:hypothetical protein
VSAFVRVYEKREQPPQPAGVKAEILDTRGKVVTTDTLSFEADQFAKDRSADYQIRLPVDRLTAGEYLLTLQATQGPHTAQRAIRFAVH